MGMEARSGNVATMGVHYREIGGPARGMPMGLMF
jgi:hypothetical protein